MLHPFPKTTVPTVRALRARAVNVPLPKPLLTAGGSVTSAPLVLIDLETSAGVLGRTYLFCYTALALRATRALLDDLAPLVVGMPLAPRAIAAQLHARFRLLGPQGLTGMAMAGIDMAAWDALAVTHDVPLCVLLGAEPRVLPAYDSHGMMSAQDGVAEGLRSAAAGFTAVKFKLGWPDADTDVRFVDAVRTALGPACEIMMDYNQCLDRGEAIRRGKLLERFDLRWIEEPCRADDDASHALVARALDTPIQLGENWWGPNDAARSLAADACDEVMLDVMKIGGVTGWLDAVALAAPTGRRVSSHLFPEFSAHLLAATPSARYLEWLDLASPILNDSVTPSDGTLRIANRPGAGIRWNEDAVQRYAVS
ncbi:MAG: mandelate racemase [Candidatus Eremiobacteraeota bacterium]|nr:mandelate racemase [Candidatus Eremiobacteraeota bacterium]